MNHLLQLLYICEKIMIYIRVLFVHWFIVDLYFRIISSVCDHFYCVMTRDGSFTLK